MDRGIQLSNTSLVCIDIRTFPWSGGEPDEEKLYPLFKHIRHSVSHFSYKIDLSQNKVDFKSVDPNTKKVKLDMAMPMCQVLNLTAQFGCWVNNTLHQERLPPWSDKEIEQGSRAAEELTRGIHWE